MSLQKYKFCILLWCIFFVSRAFSTPVEIIFWHSMAGQLGQEVVRLTKQFNQSQSDYKVKPIYKGDYMESLTSFAAAYRAQHAPNMIQVSEVGTAVMRSPKGIVKPVELLMREQGMPIRKDLWFPAVLDHYSADGLLMAMPFNVSIPVMFYNANILAKFGVSAKTFPRTWSELGVLAQRLHRAGFACTYTTAYPAWILIESYQALQGGKYDDQSMIHHLQRLRDWQLKHYFNYGGRGDDATVLFTSGKCPIFSQSSGAYAGLTELVSFPIGIAPMPSEQPERHSRVNNVVGGAAIWVPAGQSQDVERGIALYFDYISKPEQQQSWYQHTGYLPMNHDISLSTQNNAILDIARFDLGAQHQAHYSEDGPKNQIRTVNDQMLEAIFSGMMSVKDALKKATHRIEHLRMRFNKNTIHS
jgi:sn-glycerol 3-phosphate transport system substrate-binding protein